MKNTEYLPERKIKYFLEEFLLTGGWKYETGGIFMNSDIEMTRGDDKWIIEIKSANESNSVINAFVSVIGEVLLRMDDEKSKYSIALPDAKPFRRLWERLPELVKSRTRITALFVNDAGAIEEVPGSSFSFV